jgi:ribosomal protein L16 Arg81 hydroxylase
MVSRPRRKQPACAAEPAASQAGKLPPMTDHTIEAAPGDMLHIPANRAHRHRPKVAAPGTLRDVLTGFHWTSAPSSTLYQPFAGTFTAGGWHHDDAVVA